MRQARTPYVGLLVVAMTALWLAVAQGDPAAEEQQPATPSINPADTPVLLLPVLDKSGLPAKKKQRSASQVKHATDVITERLQAVGFPIIAEDKAQAALDGVGCDWQDRDEWTDEHFVAAAEAAEAKWVVGAILMESQSRHQITLWVNRKTGSARVYLIVFDAENKQRLLDDEFEATSKGAAIGGGLQSGTQQRNKAIGMAITTGLRQLCQPLGLPDPAGRNYDQK